jgi:hypothetical protein
MVTKGGATSDNSKLLAFVWMDQQRRYFIATVLRLQKEVHTSDSNRDSSRMHLVTNMLINGLLISWFLSQSGGDLLRDVCND